MIAADHPGSAADEVIDNAGFAVAPTVDAIASVLERALDGDRPPRDPVERASMYDWSAVTDQTEWSSRAPRPPA